MHTCTCTCTCTQTHTAKRTHTHSRVHTQLSPQWVFLTLSVLLFFPPSPTFPLHSLLFSGRITCENSRTGQEAVCEYKYPRVRVRNVFLHCVQQRRSAKMGTSQSFFLLAGLCSIHLQIRPKNNLLRVIFICGVILGRGEGQGEPEGDLRVVAAHP